MTLRIGYDVDGIGFTFGDSCHRYLEHIGLGHLWKSGPTPTPFWEWYKDWGWTTDQFLDFCHAGADAGFIFAGPIRPGYKEAIEATARMGHQIIIATDRSFGSSPEVSERLTVEWFREHGIEYDELHFTAHKPDAHCDYFIDDKIENYDQLVSAGTVCFLLNRPWNAVPAGDTRNRIDNIAEYVDQIKQTTRRGFFDLPLA